VDKLRANGKPPAETAWSPGWKRGPPANAVATAEQRRQVFSWTFHRRTLSSAPDLLLVETLDLDCGERREQSTGLRAAKCGATTLCAGYSLWGIWTLQELPSNPLVQTMTWHRPRIRRLWVSVCLLLAAAVIGGLPVYVRPQVDPLRHADAILVLGGYGYDRYGLGLQLGNEGWAPTVVVSNPNGTNDPWLDKLCSTPQQLRFELHCFDPDPETTKGEARELRRLATARGWRTVIVVTFRPHISRSRFILEQCFDGELVMVASPSHMSPLRWAFEYILQTAGYVRAVLQPSC
jgi:uncharacterized SAM-binding protein YcdF (DUF218 family)